MSSILLVFISGSRGFLLAQLQVLEQPVGARMSPLSLDRHAVPGHTYPTSS